MRKVITIIACLILFVFCFVNVKTGLGEENRENSMKQKRPNNLDRLYFIPQRGLIAGACGSQSNGSIRFWSVDEAKLKEVLDLGKGTWVNSMSVSNNGNLIIVSLLGENEIACYSLTERKWLWRAVWIENGVVDSEMQFSIDGQKVVVVGYRNIVTYNALIGTILKKQEDSKFFSNGFPNGRTRINGISPSAKYAAFWQGELEHDEEWWSSGNIWVLIHDIGTGKVIAKQGKVQNKYKNCSAIFTPDEKNMVLGSMDGYIRIWSILEQKVIREWRAYGTEQEHVSFRKIPSFTPIQSMTFSPDGRYLATMGYLKEGGAIRVWDYKANRLIYEFSDVLSSPLPIGSGYPMAFSPDGKFFVFERQGNVCLYDTQNWQEKWNILSCPEDERMMK